MRALELVRPGQPLKLLCIGGHSDDVEIGAGGAILSWIAKGAKIDAVWAILTAEGERAAEAEASARDFLAGAAKVDLAFGGLRDGYLPYLGGAAKAFVESLKARIEPDIILTHYHGDAHQDHRHISELTTNVFRDHLVLEYEIPKWDGDLGRPNVYVPVSEEMLARKIELLHAHFGTQRSKAWFDDETFRGLARLRGVECRSRYAEAFYLRKAVLS